MRRALEYVKAFDGVVAQHAQEPRLTEGAQMNEGELSGAARAAGLAGRRRGGDHRPRRAAGRPRRLAAARLPRLDGRLGRDPALGQGARLAGHRRGHPAPPAADRRAGRRRYDPVFKVNPPLRTADDVAALRAGAGRRHDRRRRHRPRAARARGQGLRVGRGRARHARAGDRAVGGAWRPWSRPACSTGAGVADRMSARPARIGGLDGHGRPLEAGAPANLVLVDPAARWTVDPAALATRSRNTPYAGRELPARAWPRSCATATVLARPSAEHRASTEKLASRGERGRDRAAGARGRPDVPRRGVRRGRRDVRRGRLRHRDDRLPGDADRPVATTGRSW